MRDETLFHEARQMPADERTAFLDEACKGNAVLRRRVDALLGAHDNPGSFLQRPRAEFGATVDLSPAEPPLAERPGALVGPYKLLEQIGEGGMGVVYMAEQQVPIRRRVALKVIKVGMDTRQVIARFEAERQALALMDHSNIARVLDAGATESGRPYFVMELVRGVPITEYCDQNNLPVHERLELFVQVCQAVQHAHQKGIIHRDIKPSNVLVTVNDGKPIPKVIDFGVAKATNQQLTEKTLFTAFAQMVGTPLYMSPEQAEMSSVDIDTRSDIYSLGVLLYELLTGTTPFDQERLRAVAYAEMVRIIREEEPPKPSTRISTLGEARTVTAEHRKTDARLLGQLVEGDLDWIVMKSLEKDRARRYDTATSFAADVRRYLAGEAVAAAPPSRAYQFKKFVRRHRGPVVAASLIAAALILGLAVSTVLFLWERDARQRAVAAEMEQGRLRLDAQAAQATEIQLREKAQAKEKEANTQAIKSQQVATFLSDMLKGVAPKVALGADTTLLKDILDRTAARVSKSLKNQPEVQAELLLTLSSTYGDLDESVKAEQMAREALRLRRSVFKGDHPEVAESLEKEVFRLIIISHGSPDLLRESETLAREAIAMRERLGGSNTSMAGSMNTLTQALLTEGKFSETEQLCRKILAMQPDEKGKLRGIYTLALSLREQGKLAEAITVHREILELERKVHGENSPDLIWPLNEFGVTLLRSRDLKGAEEAWRESLAIGQQYYPANHTHNLWAKDRLIELYRSQGRVAEADALVTESHETRAATTAPAELPDVSDDAVMPDPSLVPPTKSATKPVTSALAKDSNPLKTTVPVVSTPGDDLARKGDFRGAAADFVKQLAEKPDDSSTFIRLGILQAEMGDAEAYRSHCHALLGKSDPNADVRSIRGLSKLCLLAPLPEADTRIAVGLADLALSKTTESRVIAQALLGKGLAEYRGGHYPEAIQWMEKAIASPSESSPTSARNVSGAAYAIVAAACHKLHEPDKAREALFQATEGLKGKWLSPDMTDLGDHWQDVVIAHLLLREAEELLTEKPATDAKSTKPD